MTEAECLWQSLPADAGRGDLLRTMIDRVELRPNGLRIILCLVQFTPAAALTREFPSRLKRRGGMRFDIDAPDPRAANPEPVLLKEVKRTHCGETFSQLRKPAKFMGNGWVRAPGRAAAR